MEGFWFLRHLLEVPGGMRYYITNFRCLECQEAHQEGPYLASLALITYLITYEAKSRDAVASKNHLLAKIELRKFFFTIYTHYVSKIS